MFFGGEERDMLRGKEEGERDLCIVSCWERERREKGEEGSVGEHRVFSGKREADQREEGKGKGELK